MAPSKQLFDTPPGYKFYQTARATGFGDGLVIIYHAVFPVTKKLVLPGALKLNRNNPGLAV